MGYKNPPALSSGPHMHTKIELHPTIGAEVASSCLKFTCRTRQNRKYTRGNAKYFCTQGETRGLKMKFTISLTPIRLSDSGSDKRHIHMYSKHRTLLAFHIQRLIAEMKSVGICECKLWCFSMTRNINIYLLQMIERAT